MSEIRRNLNIIEAPIFLVGTERSGTTLLRLMLDHHPDIAFNLESEFLVAQIANDGVFPEMEDYRAWLAQDRVFRHSRFRIDDNLNYAALLNDFLMQKKQRGGKHLVGATVHLEFRKLNLIWPSAKYIYLYRDGRDVAKSVVQMGWAGNPYVASDWWLKAEQEWEALRSTLPAEKWIEVRYEHLIGNAEVELKRICAFLRISFSPSMYEYVNHTGYSMPDASLNYQWKNKMKRRELQLLVSKIGDRLLQRGYEMSGYSPIKPSRLNVLMMLAQSKLAALRYRIRTFGLALITQETVSRYLGWSSLNKRATNKITSSLTPICANSA